MCQFEIVFFLEDGNNYLITFYKYYIYTLRQEIGEFFHLT